ncbi:Na(+)-translocating NADH-quinone reductase subunit A [Calycomorphotria hydatis]|uniref:Na(+)-translocating NADH-quinone reductase subunit A n=1 Tax=Calycomorphotria hydatis TaxID=2528027 RepID=UPI0011A3431F
MKKIKKGLDLPIQGEPDQSRIETKSVSQVALIGPDYIGMKPTMAVAVGDSVLRGQVLFEDKKIAGVNYTSPVAGKVAEVNRGAKRVFQSIVIDVEGDGQVEFESYGDKDLTALGRDTVRDAMLKSGLWPSLRTRPYSMVADPTAVPSSIFVTATDTNPLAADPAPLIKERPDDFRYGLQALTQLTDGTVYLCTRPGADLPGAGIDSVTVEEFDGPHPSGLPGTHIHFLDPVGDKKSVWYINYADVMDIGHFFASGQLVSERVIALGGPMVKEPRLLRVPLGASITQLLDGELKEGENRLISGSVLSGRKADGVFGFLGKYSLQISVIEEGNKREFLGWQGPGFDKFSIRKIFASALDSSKKFSFTSTTNGSPRAMVPVGMYEDVMPLDILPTQLLRSLIVKDTEQAQLLGALELDEEDLALCTFVDPGKTEYGPLLRDSLTTILKEG